MGWGSKVKVKFVKKENVLSIWFPNDSTNMEAFLRGMNVLLAVYIVASGVKVRGHITNFVPICYVH